MLSHFICKRKIMGLSTITKFIVTNIITFQPISNAPTHFIEGNKKGIAGIVGPDIKEKLPTTYSSIQRIELYALYALLLLQPLSFNIYTDSKYLASLFPDFVTAFLYTLFTDSSLNSLMYGTFLYCMYTCSFRFTWPSGCKKWCCWQAHSSHFYICHWQTC